MKNKLKFKTIDINKKKIIIAILSVFIITVGIMIIKKAYSTSSPLDNQVVNGLSFENVNLNKKDGITPFECEVINDNSVIQELKTISVIIQDENNSYNLTGYIGNSIEKDEHKILKISIDQEIGEIKSITYRINK